MRKFLQHLNFALALAMLVIIYCDNRNPLMGFLSCPLGYGYLFTFAGLTALNFILLLFFPKRKKIPPGKKTLPEVQTVSKARGKGASAQSLQTSAPVSVRQSGQDPEPKADQMDLDSLISEIDELLK